MSNILRNLLIVGLFLSMAFGQNDLFLTFEDDSDVQNWGVYDGQTGYTTVAWDNQGGVNESGGVLFSDAGYTFFIQRAITATLGANYALNVEINCEGFEDSLIFLSVEGLGSIEPIVALDGGLPGYRTYTISGVSDLGTDGYITISGMASAGVHTITIDNLKFNDDVPAVFFSEYIEGSASSKALEVYNGTQAQIDLSEFLIFVNYNGNPWSEIFTFSPFSIIQPEDVYVISASEADPVILSEADETFDYANPWIATFFNGDDVRALAYIEGSDTTIIDMIGVYDLVDPGSGWSVAGVPDATKDHTLIRKGNVTHGNPNWLASAGVSTHASEWIVKPQNFFNSIGSHPYEPGTTVTFSVNMSYQAMMGNFNPGSDFVDVAGSMNDWMGEDVLTDEDGDSIYVGTFEAVEGPIEYKYRINGTWDTYEEIPYNRMDTLSTGENILPTVWYQDLNPYEISSVEVLFQVDMNFQIHNGAFNPNAGDLIVIRGGHENLGNWGGSVELERDYETPSTYSYLSLFDNLSVNEEIQYKFVILTEGDVDQAIWENTENRSFQTSGTEPDTDQNGYGEIIQPVVYFADESPDSLVKFSVNMELQSVLGNFNPFVDHIELRGSFNNWGGDQLTLSNEDSSSIYEIEVDFSAYNEGDYQEYKFVIVTPSEEIWEDIDNRSFSYNGLGMELPLVWFENLDNIDQGEPWAVQIAVWGGELSDHDNNFGTEWDATFGYDMYYDVPEPPLPPSNYLQLYFPHEEWGEEIGPNFTTDYRAPVSLVNNTLSWDFVVATDLEQTDITLDFSHVPGIPPVTTYILEDITHGVIHNLNSNLQYSYNSDTGGLNEFRVSVGQSASSELNHPFDPGWHLFSLPLVTGFHSIWDLLAPYSNLPIYVYSYDQWSSYYMMDHIEQGRGYWLAASEYMDVHITGLADTTNFSTELQRGWNIIGNPFAYSKPVSAIQIEYNGQTVDFGTAAANNWVAGSIYGYSDQSYVLEDYLLPWGGYWLSALVDNVLFHLDFTDDGTALRSDQATRSEEEWYLTISAQQGDRQDEITQLGVHPEASAGFDANFDYPEPPQPPSPSHVSSYFVHSTWNEVLGSRYNRDIRSPILMDEEDVWQMTVQSEPGDVELTWSYDLGELPEEMHFVLVDIQNEITINMNELDSYQFNNSGGESIFLITAFRTVVGVEANNIPKQFELHQNYPNPFNPSTTIAYGIPEDSDVSVVIYDVSGKEVKTLIQSNQSAGWYNQIWNGLNNQNTQVSTGVYFARVTSGKNSETIKMVYLK